jgi:hypothetical protein
MLQTRKVAARIGLEIMIDITDRKTIAFVTLI